MAQKYRMTNESLSVFVVCEYVRGCGCVICLKNANKVKANKHNRVLLELLEVWPNFANF